jgi:hypothetical protein
MVTLSHWQCRHSSYFQAEQIIWTTNKPALVDDHNLPPQKPHPNLEDSFLPLADAARPPRNCTANAANGTRSKLRTTRILSETRRIVAGGLHETYDAVADRERALMERKKEIHLLYVLAAGSRLMTDGSNRRT